jgi:Xaa-Pro aminopeptidase
LQGTGIELYKLNVDGFPKLVEFLGEKFSENDVIIANLSTISTKDYESFTEKCTIKHDVEWENIWKERPRIKKSDIWKLNWAEQECPFLSKIAKLREKIEAESADYYLVSALDELSWLFNIRAFDIEYTPVVRGFAIVGLHKIMLFLDAENSIDLQGVEIYHYDEIYNVISTHRGTLVLDKNKVNALLYKVCEENFCVKSIENPITNEKAKKSEQEIAGCKRANVNDGVVWVRLMMFIEDALENNEKITELSVSEKMTQLKAMNEDFLCESFESIVAYADNAAIVHYAATLQTDKEIQPEGLLLIDSGTHYIYGTTDITRTLVCGSVTNEQIRRFTQVLKGMIAVATAEFTNETKGKDIDVLARKFLKEDGEDFAHGSGHGVGSVLCVHEDGVRLSPKGEGELLPNVITSDEPGYYKAGEFGIRIENMLLCTANEQESLNFCNLTLVPIDVRAIDVALLSNFERDWINIYHREIKNTLHKFLTEKENKWLNERFYEI